MVNPGSSDLRRHYIFSTEGSAFHDWQAEVLLYSHRRQGLGGRMTRIVSCDDNWRQPHVSDPEYSIVRVPRFNPLDGDEYPLRNRPHSLVHVFRHMPGYIEPNEVVILLDPDQVLVGSPEDWNTLFQQVAAHGPVAAGYGIGSAFLDSWADRFCDGLGSKASDWVRANIAVGAPYILFGRDLEAIAPVWVEVMEQMRRDSGVAAVTAWCTDMYAYAIATIRLGLTHARLPLMVSAPFDGDEPWDLATVDAAGRPRFLFPLVVVHYCQRLAVGSYSWSKHDYHQFALDDRMAPQLFPLVSTPEDVNVLKGVLRNLSLNPRLLRSGEFQAQFPDMSGLESSAQTEAHRSALLYASVVPRANEALRAYYASRV